MISKEISFFDKHFIKQSLKIKSGELYTSSCFASLKYIMQTFHQKKIYIMQTRF